MNTERFSEEERQVIKEVAKLLVDVSETTSHITDENKDAMFSSLRTLMTTVPMVNGYLQINQIRQKIIDIILNIRK